MATNDNYIGIAMGLDVTDLKSGLSEANKQIQLANSEFKAASSGMDDWTKSAEGLNAKVTQLTSVLDNQKKKLAGIKAEYDKVVASQGENSEAARKLKVQMNNQQAVVNSTERELNNYKETLEGVENGTIDLTQVTLKGGKALSNMGDSAEEGAKGLEGLKGIAKGIGGALIGLGTTVAGVVTGFLSLGESTRETRKLLGQLETAFTTAGLSAEDSKNTYEQLYGVLGDEGKATEAALHIASLSHSQEDLAKWTDIATGVYATFGDSLPIEALAEAANETSKTGQITGGLADALNWAGVSEEQFQKQLDACTSEQERQALITSTLNGLYDEASTKYQEVNKDVIEAQEAQAKLTDTMAELGAIAEPIMTTLKLVVVDLLNEIKPFVELIGEGLKGAFEGTSGAAETLASGVSGILNILVEKATTLLPAIISVVMQLIPKLAEALLNALPQIMSTVLQLVSKIIEMLGTLIPQIVTKIIEIVPLLIQALVDAIPRLLQGAIKFLMAIIQAIPTIINALITALPKIIRTVINGLLKAIPQLLKGAIQLFMAIVEAIPKIIPSLIAALPTIIKEIVNGLIAGIPDLIKAGADLLGGLIEGLLDPEALWNAIEKLGENIVNGFKDFFGIHSPSKLMEDEIGKYLGLGVGEGLLNSLPAVKKDLNKFKDYVTANLGGIKTGLDVNNNVSGLSASRNGTIINAGMNITYNGNLSRKQLRQLERDNYLAIKTKLKMEGAI